MKKILFSIFLFLLIAMPTIAITEREENHINFLMSQIKSNISVDEYNKATDYFLKLSRKYKAPINLKVLDTAVQLNMDRYNTVKQIKYKKKALKYATIAKNEGTKNLNTILTAIAIAGENLDIKTMIEFYDYMCKVNPQAGRAIKEVFSKNIEEINRVKAYNSSVKWANFNQLLYVYLQNRPRYSTTTGSVDANGFVNLNTVSY